MSVASSMEVASDLQVLTTSGRAPHETWGKPCAK